jgi:anti-sigma factor RsiW
MACPTIYEQLMSLRLDGLLTPEDERRLELHVVRCTECAELWGAMRQADTLLVASAHNPAPMAADFTIKVMARVSTHPVVRPQPVEAVAAAPVALPGSMSVLPPMGRPLSEYEEFPLGLPDYIQDWRERVAAYARGIAVAGLSMAAAVGLLLVLVVSGVLEVGETFAPAVQMARTFFSTATLWLRSLFAGVGLETVGIAVLLMSIVALAGWQIVANYYQVASQQRSDVAPVEAML